MRPLLTKLAVLGALAAGSFSGEAGAAFKQRDTLLPAERLPTADCPASNCLVIEDNATYCSIDPFTMRDGQVFATKSELRLSSGAYPLPDRQALAGFPIRLVTPAGERTFRPLKPDIFTFNRDEPDRETGIEPLDWIEVESAYVAADADISKFFLRTSRWPHDQFRLGDPQDIRWFFEAARNLFISVSDGGPLFPHLSHQTIFFAPCAMRDVPDQLFRFEFKDGSALDLRVRAVNGVNQIGYYMGRLMEAKGRLAGEGVRVTDRNDLAFFGSTRSWGEMAIPTLAVRTGGAGHICGLVLDASLWDTDEAVNGYVAVELTCDERRGARLPLKAVSYPKVFSLP